MKRERSLKPALCPIVLMLSTVALNACDGPGASNTGGLGSGRIAWSVSSIRAPSRTGALAVDSEHVYAYVNSLRITEAAG